MKKFMKTAGWQIGAFVLAIGAAFATNAMKDTTLFATEMGYLPMNTEATVCDDKIECSTIINELCTWRNPITSIDHQVFGLEADPISGLTKCTKKLYIKTF